MPAFPGDFSSFIGRSFDTKPHKGVQVNDCPSILRLPEVLRRTGLSRSTVYSYIAKPAPSTPAFPQPVKIGQRAVGFMSDEIENWIAACASSRVVAK